MSEHRHAGQLELAGGSVAKGGKVGLLAKRAEGSKAEAQRVAKVQTWPEAKGQKG